MAIRHFQGSYRCVAVTARYFTTSNASLLAIHVENALTNVILRHPVLCVGIIQEGTERPAFVRLESIDLMRCVEYRDVIAFTPEEYTTALEKILERQHSQRWRDVHCQPPWKIIVVQSRETASARLTFDLIFAYHHALADGISGLVFHQSLLEAFNANGTVKNLADLKIKTPESLMLPAPIEKQYKFKISVPILTREWWTHTRPTWVKWPGRASFWTSPQCSLQNVQNCLSRANVVSIGAYQLALILTKCRREGTTLTGLLHGIIIASLTSHVPEARRFKAGTPYSLRHLLNESSRDEMGVFSFGFSNPYSMKTISKFRACQEDLQFTNQIWDIARAFSTSVAIELESISKGHFIGIIPRAKNLRKALSASIEKPRYETFEVSNLGSFRSRDEKENQKGNWKIENMVFSQSGQGIGPAVCFNAVSVAGGPLTVCATWLEGAIEEQLVNSICEDITYILNSLSRGVVTSGTMPHPGKSVG